MNLYTQIQQSVQDHYGKFIQHSKKPYMKEAFIGLIGAVLLSIAYFGYSWYQKRQNIQAFTALVEISKSYEQSIQKANQLKDKPTDQQTENPWEDTKLLLEVLSSSHSGSSLAPFFIMYQAEVAMQAEDDYDKACKLMEKGIRGLSKKSPYYDMFNFKRIKMLLDSPMENVRIAALKELQSIANESKNYYQQQALYTIAAYESYYGNMEVAIESWKKLAQQAEPENLLISSPWVTQAQEKLKTLNIAIE